MKSRKTTVFLIFWGMCFPLKSYTQVLTSSANAPREGDLLRRSGPVRGYILHLPR